MKEKLDVHDTAFMTSAFRAANVELSHDQYASLWLNENAQRWSQDYLDKVSTEEDSAHCLRNRYFMDRISALHAKGEIEVLINFGSGFSMYPYLLPETLINIEIDKPEVIEHKQNRTKEWQASTALPPRDIHYISVDFTTNFQGALREQLLKLIAGKSSFILLEGVLFFLEKKESDQLFEFFGSIQQTKGYVGSASFRPSLTKTTAWSSLMDYVGQETTATEDTFRLTLEDDYYRARDGYQLKEVQDFFSLSAEYQHQPKLEEDLILNECFYLLART